MSDSSRSLLDQTRTICLALPEVSERLSHGTPTFFIRDRTAFVYAWVQGHHDDTFPHLWCAAGPGVQEVLLGAEPEHFFRPPYVGHRGWVGVRLDGTLDWDEVGEVCQDAFRAVGPRRLVATLDAGPA